MHLFSIIPVFMLNRDFRSYQLGLLSTLCRGSRAEEATATSSWDSSSTDIPTLNSLWSSSKRGQETHSSDVCYWSVSVSASGIVIFSLFLFFAYYFPDFRRIYSLLFLILFFIALWLKERCYEVIYSLGPPQVVPLLSSS